MTDPDLLAVRRLGSEPTDESVTRSWYRITQLEAQRAKPNRLQRLIPIAAAAMVALVVAGSLIVLRVGEGMWWPADSTPEAVAALNSLADTAAGGAAVTIGAGQLIRNESHGWGGECGPYACVMKPQNRDVFYDPATGKTLKIMDGGVDLMAGPRAEPQAEVTPGIHFPTLTWLAALPTEPGQLLSQLRVEVGEHDKWTVDHQLWDALGQLFANCEIALTPQQRATLLRAMGGMTGLTSRTVTIGGQNLIAVQHMEDNSGDDIYFDPYTGHAVGRGSVFTHEGMTITAPAGAPSFEPGVAYQATWTQSVVDPE